MAWVIIESAPLSNADMHNNAQEYANDMLQRGHTPEAISGELGNIQAESGINPARWQSDIVGNYSGGFGLVQWTPATNYTVWAIDNGYAITDPYGQEYWIDVITPNGQWIPTSQYPLSWEEFRTSTDSPENLASAFLKNFERAGVEVEEVRREQARYWYETLDWSGHG